MRKETLLVVIILLVLGFSPSVASGDVTCVDTSPNGRWCDKGDGTVLDTTTGLYWLKIATCFGHNLNWWSAEWTANNLQDDSHGGVGCYLSDGSVAGDWRLPTEAEFLDAMSGTEIIYMPNHYGGDPSSCNPGCYGSLYFFDNVAGQYYWTSTDATYGAGGARVAYIPYAIYATYSPSFVYFPMRNFPKGVETYVWPVRESLVQEVSIDIKPGSDPNCFNINGHGVIPVAILGSDEFDVSDIDPDTLLFGGLEVRVRGNKGPLCHVEDTNSDSLPDLVCQFEDDSENWVAGDSTATLTGTLLDGSAIEGTDSICIVPPE